jgi:hypothetical protein
VASHRDSDDDSDVGENITVSPRQTAQAQTNQGDTDIDCYIVKTPKFGSLRWRREEQRRLSRQPKKIREGKQPSQDDETTQDDGTTQDDETMEDASSANKSVESVVVKTA